MIVRKLFQITFVLLQWISFRYLLPERLSTPIEAVRTQVLRQAGAKIGAASFVRSHVLIVAPTNLAIGARTKVGEFARIYNFARFEIGDDVEIGPGLTVLTNEHILDGDGPLAKQGASSRPVRIGSNCYLGCNVTLLSGAVIEDRVVVGAGSVVRDTLQGSGVYAGVPAKRIRDL